MLAESLPPTTAAGPAWKGKAWVRRPPASSYAAGAAAAEGDAYGLALLALNWLAATWQLRGCLLPHEISWAAGMTAFCAAVLALLLLAPATYRRYRLALNTLLRLHIPVSLLCVDAARALGLMAVGSLEAGGATATRDFLAALVTVSGVLGLVQGAYTFTLPPFVAAGVQLVATAAVASTDSALCTSTFLQHPAAMSRLDVLYRWLEPAMVPLEPLLLAAGVGRGHPRRHCHCVLAALHFWASLVLPILLTVRSQWRAYSAWKDQAAAARRLQRQLERQQRRKQAESWGFGFKEPSSSSSSSSSACCSDSCTSASAAVGGGGGSGGGYGDSSSSSDSGADSAPLVAQCKPIPIPIPIPIPTTPAQELGGAPPSKSPLPPAAQTWRRRQQGRQQRGAVSRGSRSTSKARSGVAGVGPSGGGSHPDDWQYEAAGRVLCLLSMSPQTLVLTVIVAMHAYNWHYSFFP